MDQLKDNVVIYARVSSSGQSVINQIKVLEHIAEQNNWNLIDTYIDEGISGKYGRDRRPEFNRMNIDLIQKKFNRILVWDISRIGRSLTNLVTFLSEVNAKKCDLYIHQSGLDTSTPSGRMMFQMISVFSEFEREMISERVKAGLQRVRAQGKKLGRGDRITKIQKTKVINLLDNGYTYNQIKKEVGLSKASISRIKNEKTNNCSLYI